MDSLVGSRNAPIDFDFGAGGRCVGCGAFRFLSAAILAVRCGQRAVPALSRVLLLLLLLLLWLLLMLLLLQMLH